MIDDDIPTKAIWVHDFEESDVTQFQDSINERFEECPTRPVIINIKSYGGSVHGLFSMLDIMDSYKQRSPEGFYFITHAVGAAMSAGALLLASGDCRFASPRCTLMVHQIIGGTGWGLHHPDNKVEFYQQDRLNDSVLETLAKSCKITNIGALTELLSQNLYLTPQESVKFGLIDVVGTPVLIDKVTHELQVTNRVEVKDIVETPNYTVKKKAKKVKKVKKK